MPLAQQSPIKYSAKDLLRFQSEGGLEFVNGQITHKPVSIQSCLVVTTLIRLLGNHAKGGKAHVFAPSMGYQCFPADPSRYRKPDVSVVRLERLTGFDPDAELIPFPPDLAVEVVHGKDVSYALSERVFEYLNNGFLLIWVIHPNTRTVTVYRGDGSVSVLHEQDEITGEGVLPSFRCKVSDLFTT
jgi:Uma2 family endonuclease